MTVLNIIALVIGIIAVLVCAGFAIIGLAVFISVMKDVKKDLEDIE